MLNYSGRQNLRFWLITFTTLLVVSSCGQTSSQTPGAQPGSPTDPATNPQNQAEPEVRAEAQIGSVIRNFSEQNATTCTLDRNRKEAVVTFNDEQNGASFSVRMSNMDLTKTSHDIVSLGRAPQGTVMISLGGERRQNQYRLNQPEPGVASTVRSSACKVNYEVSQTHFAASFQCQNLVNSIGQSAGGAGRWLCKLQAPTEWTW